MLIPAIYIKRICVDIKCNFLSKYSNQNSLLSEKRGICSVKVMITSSQRRRAYFWHPQPCTFVTRLVGLLILR